MLARLVINNTIPSDTFTCNSYTLSVQWKLFVALYFLSHNIALEDIIHLQRVSAVFWAQL